MSTPQDGNIYTWNFSQYHDDDFGAIGSYYTTYFWFAHDMEQQPMLMLHRKLFTFLALHLKGEGQIKVTPYVDALTNPTTAFVATLDSTDPGFDIEFVTNILGERVAYRVEPTPLSGLDAAFSLTHMIVSARQDRVFPIRGSVFF